MLGHRSHGRDLTSYDLVKTFAIVITIVDHAGAYLFVDEPWFRAVGRLCLPVWFFLIGYARTRELEPRLWIGAGILLIARFAAGVPMLSLPVLVTFLAVRRFIDRVGDYVTRGKNERIVAYAAIFSLALPTMFISEYGTSGLMLALTGWMVRRRQDGDPRVTAALLNNQFVLGVLFFVFWEYMMFGFSGLQAFSLLVAALGVGWGLLSFRPAVFPAWNAPMRAPLRNVLQFCGRWTLEIYVLHIIAFQQIATVLHPEKFPAFTLKFLPLCFTAEKAI